jgi:hypothetical protein
MCRDLAKKGNAFGKRMLENWVNDALAGMRCSRFRMPVAPTVLTGEELRVGGKQCL